MTGILNVLVAPTPAASGPKTVTYQTEVESSASQASYTFSSVAIGTASSDRCVIIAINTLNTTTILGTVTIGGINATQIVKGARGGGATEFWAAMVPTGTTATIVVPISANNPTRIGVLVWTATGMSSATAVGTGTNTSASSPHSTAAFATVSGGFVLMSSCDNGGAATFTESVSGGGTPAITENFDAVFGGSPTMVGALTGATDGTNITVTITGGTSANGGMAAASF